MNIPFVDNFLNKITMYRLTIYSLIFLLCVGMVVSFFHLVPFTPVQLLFSTAFFTIFCLIFNQCAAWLYKAPSNVESVYITAFILTLIITPVKSTQDVILAALISALAMSSKYILAINRKHLFNPAAFAVVVASYVFGTSASWWIGTLFMAPFVLITGILITRKIRRPSLVISFLLTAMVCTGAFVTFMAGDHVMVLKEALIYSPLLFFGFVMLTEPATTPPTKHLQIIYGMLNGILFVPFLHIGNFYVSPELDLILCNIFSYLVSPKEKLLLVLKEKLQIANNTYDFVFSANLRLKFKPGQYMEWTLVHEKADTRGVRRYFTIASSPTEDNIRIGVKFYDQPSSYKKSLESLDKEKIMVAGQLAGDFTLPKDVNQKLVFIAGGIGVTPFRSMVKYLIDSNQRRDIIIFYANNHYADVAYKEVFDVAHEKLDIKTIYTLNDTTLCPPNFDCEKGYLSEKMIEQHAPDFKDRIFYISGPKSMIDAFEKTLHDMGIPKNHIKTDFFPGFA